MNFDKGRRMSILPLVYQFVVGGIIFFMGFFLSWKSGDYSWKISGDRSVSVYMVAGFFLYFVFQIAWHFFALKK